MRTGLGIDTHRFAEGRRLILGGVEIPHERGLDGHSDADVLAHAITDAILGAASMGDIGQHFPDTDPAFKDADSIALLREVVRRVAESGWRVEHVDATVMLERATASYSDAYNAAIRDRLGATSPNALYIEADDLDDLHAKALANGAAVIDPLADRPWGQAEFTVADPDGNWLTFWKSPHPVTPADVTRS